MKFPKIPLLLFLSIYLISCSESDSYKHLDYSGWETFGGTKDAARYSSLDQVNKENVKNLEVAWTYHTSDSTTRSQIQCQPIVANGILYATSPQLNVFALDAFWQIALEIQSISIALGRIHGQEPTGE
jgi:quinoprotein glucose dehydrogenase